MSTPPLPTDPTRCPLCGGDNRCAMEVEKATGQVQAPCWCMAQPFPVGLLDRLPDAARGTACICARCVAGFHAAQTPAPPEAPSR